MAYDKKYKRRHAARRFGCLRLKRGSAAFPESGGILMYQQEYERWLAAELEDKDLKPELLSIQGIDAEIQDRFAVELEFGTAGLRGVLGAGTNRMNIYMVRKATQGLANYLNKQGGKKSVAISYDSRIKSDVFAREAARVLAGNGVKAYLYKEMMPVPALSFATRHLHCDWGDICDEDWNRNDHAVKSGGRLLSAYLVAGEKVFIITEWDRSVTTILFADEY